MAARRYCFACKRRHQCSAWYGSEWYEHFEEGVYFCRKEHMRLFRAGHEVIHPSAEKLLGATHQTDNTGCRIVAAKFRCDCTAIMNSAVQLSLYTQWADLDLYIMLLAAQFYFPWPMHDLLDETIDSKADQYILDAQSCNCGLRWDSS